MDEANDTVTDENIKGGVNDGSPSNKNTDDAGGESVKRKSEELTATPERGPRGGLRSARNLSGWAKGPDAKKKKGGIAELFKK